MLSEQSVVGEVVCMIPSFETGCIAMSADIVLWSWIDVPDSIECIHLFFRGEPQLSCIISVDPSDRVVLSVRTIGYKLR